MVIVLAVFQLLLPPTPADIRLPSLSYWKILQRLRVERSLREELQIKNEQLEELRTITNSTLLRREHEEKVVELRGLSKDKKTGLRGIADIAWLALDEVVALEVSTVLSKEQFARLRPYSFAKRFPLATFVFFDRDVLDLLGLSRQQKQELKDKANQRSAELSSELRNRRLKFSQPILTSLPGDAKQQFESYVGLGGSMETDLETSDFPFPPVIRSSIVFSFLRNSASNREAIGMGEDQFQTLQRIAEDLNRATRVSDFTELHDPKRRQIVRDANAKAMKEFANLLSEEQTLQLAQAVAYQAFLADFSRPFRTKEVTHYIGLDAKQLATILSVAETQKAKLRASLDELNRSIFEELANELPSDTRERLDDLFPAGWPTLPMPLTQ